ncbi:MAG: glycosyltransferase family 2 protein [Anaerostipes sp.]|jgi:glycosyltransferase involved in cell wall biosynthesis|nr:glycosyltransferase family 2 protein [Anaerostipes sp.]
MLSIVLPSYNEEANIEKVTDVILSLMKKENIEVELIFIDDGSTDATWKKICLMSKEYSQVVGITFSRNFGKEAALAAGLDYAKGDCVAVMDCDLQHPPETLTQMYHLWEDGFQVVEGIKSSRGKEGIIYKLFAKTFYKLISNATGIDMSKASDFKLLDRKVVDEYCKLPERNIFFRALSSWVGFKTTYVEFDVQEREAGESKWSFKSLVKYAINGIASFSSSIMQVVTACGIIFFVFAVILGIQSLVKYFMGHSVEGFTTVILLVLLTGSILMFSLGVIGYYISKIYDEIKMRPKYIVSEVVKTKERS